MPLTDTAIKALRPSGKMQRHYDGGGLYIEISPAGSKIWRLKYRFEGKEKRLTIGAYPAVSLRDARIAMNSAKDLLRSGDDPSVKKKTQSKTKEKTTFSAVALDWISRQSGAWVEKHAHILEGRFRSHIFPHIGNAEIAEIKPQDVLAIARTLEEDHKNYTARRVIGMCSQVFRYAIACGMCQSDPCRDLRGALTAHQPTPRAALTSPRDVAALMSTIQGYQGYSITRYALLWSAYTFCRPGEVRRAEWCEIQYDKQEWRIPAEKMKMRREHRVPLARQCMEILEKIRTLGYSDKWIFPSVRPSIPLSENGVLSALRRMGYEKHEMSAHGFRAMASTLLNELGFRPDLIERQLAHECEDKVRAVYNRAAYMDERRAMMQQWADYLDSLAVERFPPVLQ